MRKFERDENLTISNKCIHQQSHNLTVYACYPKFLAIFYERNHSEWTTRYRINKDLIETVKKSSINIFKNGYFSWICSIDNAS